MPAYNAARTLERTYADIPHALVDQIILVDDVSADETVDIARQLGLHVIIGMCAILWIMWRTSKGHFTPTYYQPVDLVGLYWHLVDLVWIYLFPLLYLIA